MAQQLISTFRKFSKMNFLWDLLEKMCINKPATNLSYKFTVLK